MRQDLGTRRPVPGRLDTLEGSRALLPGICVRASRGQRQLNPALLHLGRPLQFLGFRREHRDRQWHGCRCTFPLQPAHGAVHDCPRALSSSVQLSFSTTLAGPTRASTIRTPAGKDAASGPCTAPAAPCSPRPRGRLWFTCSCVPVRWRRKSPDIDQQPTGGDGAMGPADASLVLSVSSVVSQNSADGSS